MNNNRLRNVVEDSLQRRLMGSSHCDTSIELLDMALDLQFRTYFHVFQQDNINSSFLQTLTKECSKLLLSMEHSIKLISGKDYYQLIMNIVNNCQGIIYFHMKENIKALKSFNQLKKIEPIVNFDLLLKLEQYYYLGLLSKKFDINDFLSLLRDIPHYLLSKGYIFDYIYLISNELKIDLTTLQKSLQSDKFTYVPIYFLLFILNKDVNYKSVQSIQDNLIAFFEKYLTQIKFPNADEQNDKLLIDCQLSLQFFFQKFYYRRDKLSPQWYKILVNFMGKTFQDIEISKTAMVYFMITGNVKESVLNFNNLMKYSKKNMELNGGDLKNINDCNNINKYDDIISLIESYCFVLNNLFNENRGESLKEIFQMDSIMNELLQLLILFYQYNKFKLFNDLKINQRDSLNFVSNHIKIVLPKKICEILTNSWQILFKLKKNDLTSLQNNQLTSYLCNAMSLFSKSEVAHKKILKELYFEYAFTLSQMRQIDISIEFLENQILNKDPLFYKAWHLLALCKSVQEDKQDSYKIICSVLESMVNESDVVTDEDKWQLINLKITQIYLLNEIFGTRDAIEIIPDLFALYHDLYDDDNDNNIDSNNSHNEETNKNTKNSIYFYSRDKLFILQTIWLLTAEFYMELYDQERQMCENNDEVDGIKELLQEAKNAIKESNKINTSFKNINYYIVNSYLSLLQGSPKNSMAELEKALFYDDMNVDAIVAMSELVLPLKADHKDIEAYLPLISSTKEPLKETETIFANETDQSAAYARLKLLLESCIIGNIDAYYSAEIWWFLSQIYEKYQDREYPDSLLTCIKNKETTPIRAFQYCHY